MNPRIWLFLLGLVVIAGFSALAYRLIESAVDSRDLLSGTLALLSVSALVAALTRFKPVPVGSRGILTYLTPSGAFAETDIGPGYCWTPPLIAALRTFSSDPTTWTLDDFVVESGNGLDFTVSISIGWQVTQEGLVDFGSTRNLRTAIEAHIKGTAKNLLSRVGAETDRAALVSRLQDVIRESLMNRSRGVETRQGDGDWRTASLTRIESDVKPWGLAISDVQILRLDLPGEVKDAVVGTTAGSVRTGELPRAAERIANAVGALGKVGVDAEISTQVVQSQLAKPPLPQRDYYMMSPSGQNVNIGYAKARTVADSSRTLDGQGEDNRSGDNVSDAIEGKARSRD